MAIAFISSVAAAGSPTGGTTGSVDTTGANFIAFGVAYNAGSTVVVSDSKLNTWNVLTVQTHGAVSCAIYYAINPTVGTGHTFTTAGVEIYTAMAVEAFSGVHTTAPFDQENGANAFASTLATGSVTPGEDSEVVITVLASNGACTPTSIDGGFTETSETNFGSGNNYGVSLAYLIQTTAAAANPTWTRTNTNGMAARIATFKVAATSAVKGQVLGKWSWPI